jgi:hypothetical protein
MIALPVSFKASGPDPAFSLGQRVERAKGFDPSKMTSWIVGQAAARHTLLHRPTAHDRLVLESQGRHVEQTGQHARPNRPRLTFIRGQADICCATVLHLTQQRALLKHHAALGVGTGHVMAVQLVMRPSRWNQKSGHDVQERGLAASLTGPEHSSTAPTDPIAGTILERLHQNCACSGRSKAH